MRCLGATRYGSDVKPFQVLLHLFDALFDRMAREKRLDVGFKLASHETDDTLAHARNGIVRILPDHFLPMRFQKGPRALARITVKQKATH